jgi:hypothetical protein
VKLSVGFGPGVLLGDARAELNMLADSLAEGLIVAHADFVERLEV